MKSKERGGRVWNLSGLEQLKEPLFSPSPELPDPAAELGPTQNQRGEAKSMSKERRGPSMSSAQTASPLWGPIGPAGGGDDCWGPSVTTSSSLAWPRDSGWRPDCGRGPGALGKELGEPRGTRKTMQLRVVH